MLRAGLIFCLCLLGSFAANAAEVIPPTPKQYFNDYAGVVPPAQVQQLNSTLEDFERTNSSQIVVAVFAKMQSESSIEDYANRVFRAWGVGQKDKNNGAVLFVFVQDRRLRIEVGYGLEGVMPDALCKRIIEDEITPRFRNGDYPGGLTAGVNAMLAAAKGEYRGTGKTVDEQRRNHGSGSSGVGAFTMIFIVVIIIIVIRAAAGGGSMYSRRGFRRRSTWGGWGGGFGGGGGGGSSWGGGGGFSGGGGSSGGGGASGSW